MDRLSHLLKTYNSAFGAGLVFSAADIVVRINCDMELKELAGKLFSEKNRMMK